MSGYRIAVDIGGTFTDIVGYDPTTGDTHTAKVLSTPEDLSVGILQGIRRLAPNLAELDFFVHGTTAALNAFLERKGANVALLTTEGFRDVYEIGRASRPDMYNLFYRKPTPLVRRRHIYEVPERTLYDGTKLRPLSRADLDAVVARLQAEPYTSIAVCLLHAYVNPEHELLVAEVLRDALPGRSISLSHQVAGEWREYERTSTTVLNAYVAPIIERYLSRLEQQAAAAGFDNDLHLMESNGGVMTSQAARARPIQTLFSGPVGGAMGGVALGEMLGASHLIGVDMGGTSFDVSLVVNGQADVTTETELQGFPVLMPTVNIHTIGAGGGSIAWLEAGGLRVGPHSAGARPGPACYGRGGTQPTVTDANLVLGRIDPQYFVGGELTLDAEAACQALTPLAAELGLSIEMLAEGILDIVNANMANAIRAITIGRGIDPRDFALVAFGGAGPMHAVFLAEELHIPRVLVPFSPGTYSAWGMLQTDIRHDLVRTHYRSVAETLAPDLETAFQRLEAEGVDILQGERVAADAMRFVRSADMRYVGQEYFVSIPMPDTVDDANLAALPQRFHDAYLQRYGHSNSQEAIEFVNLRISAQGVLPKSRPAPAAGYESRTAPRHAQRPVVFKRQTWDTGVYYRDELSPGDSLVGPAIVEEKSCTTVIPPGFGVEVDGLGNLVITPA
ncbi:MAG: hydantoinase/oxoprolinase family protein [Anaerolineae bacterium]